ncbi:unnamed protein product, partial [Ectocarpus sp. 8 AP-2014]
MQHEYILGVAPSPLRSASCSSFSTAPKSCLFFICLTVKRNFPCRMLVSWEISVPPTPAAGRCTGRVFPPLPPPLPPADDDDDDICLGCCCCCFENFFSLSLLRLRMSRMEEGEPRG